MSGYDQRAGCPHCGEKEELATIHANPQAYGMTVTCLRCGWTGEESDLLTDAEARLEGRLHRLDL